VRFTVLGASGFIGRNLVVHLRSQGHEVLTPARDDPSVLTEPLGHVFYCIGLTADFRSRPFDSVRAHVGVLADILQHASFTSLVYLSSTRVYAKSLHGSEQEAVVVDSNDPSDLYNLSKLAGESLCRASKRCGVKVVRLSNVIGPDARSENFLFVLIREALSGRIVLQSDPTSCKDYIRIDDVVGLLPRVASEGQQWIYNLGSGVNLRHREIVDKLSSLTGCAVEVIPDAIAQVFPIINIDRISQEFGFVTKPILDYLPDLISEISTLDGAGTRIFKGA
jgi:nucleoside-diphosphate-sugar epimerase